MTQAVFPDVQKIAVFRATALGDLIFVLPALRALRCTYPRAEIVYLGRDWHTAFLPGRLAGPHRVIAVPPPRITKQIIQGLVIDPEAGADFFARMRAEAFDLALQLHGGGEYSNPFVLALEPRFSVGLKSARAAPLDRWIPYIYYQHEVARLLEVVSLAGACPTPGDLQPSLPVLAGDLDAAAPALAELRRPFVALHPGSTDPRRCWSPLKYAAVADACAALGLAVVLTGSGPADAARIQAVQQAMRAPAHNLCDRLSLPGLVGLLAQARLFIGNDSGPLHLALAVGARAVGLFWAEYTLNSLPLLRERFYPLIAWQRTCSLCGRTLDKAEADTPSNGCTHEVSFIEEIQPEDVLRGVAVLFSD